VTVVTSIQNGFSPASPFCSTRDVPVFTLALVAGGAATRLPLATGPPTTAMPLFGAALAPGDEEAVAVEAVAGRREAA
jgi:hypothetical protein